MNRSRSVWLPPDGDDRLVRFQHRVARLCGQVDGPPLPPYLALTTSRVPQGPVVCGAWGGYEDTAALEAQDDEGPLGWFLLGVTAGVLPSPGWSWTRGVLATLELCFPDGDEEFVLWAWKDRHGWKACPSRP